MIDIIIWILILISSLAVLAKSSEWFTESAEKIGLSFNLSPFIIGITIIAIGTSLPELFSSILSVTNNASEIVIGNVLGANIANLLLILGLSAIISKEIEVKDKSMKTHLAVLIVSVIMLFIICLDGKILLYESIVFLLSLSLYLLLLIKKHKKQSKKIKLLVKKEPINHKIISTLIISIILLYFSANYVVQSITFISTFFNMGKETIAATILSLGTTLPELAVSVVAARKKKVEIAVGNILGSNIFNTFGVIGFSGLFGIIIVPSQFIFVGMSFLVAATLLYVIVVKDRKISYWEGWVLLIIYILFFIQILGLA